MTQGNLILNFLEKVCRSNIYLFIISRYLIGKYFSRIIFDNDFNIIKILESQNYFQNNRVIVDIGANDGMSYQIIRKFSKRVEIVSFEPIKENFNIVLDTINKEKPAGIKGNFILSAYLTSTMGISYRLKVKG